MKRAVVLLSMALVGCGGDGVLEPPGLATSDGQVTFSAIQSAVLIPRCASCHHFPADHAYLVNAPSTQPPFLLVEPGNPDDSYMYMKLVGDPRIMGDRMPQGGPYLDPVTLEAIRFWIQAGALNN